jgi:Lon protease-like protein
MVSSHLRIENLPDEFPVFPLTGALLLPRGKLPLNIFEPRYLAMIDDALAAGRIFAMIQPDASRHDIAEGPALFSVGCLGRLSSFSETDDGRYLITLLGLIRFRVVQELPSRNGYRRVRGDFSAYRADLDQPDPAADGAIARVAVVAALRGYFAHSGFDANWDAIERMPDEALVTTLSMVCPFEPAEKQALLEAGTDVQRAATLLTLLQMGAADDGSAGSGRAVS